MTKFILVDGTSSSGKSTICKYFSKKDFLCFQLDDYFNDKRINYNGIFKKIKNTYGETSKIYDYEPVRYMIDDAIKTNKNILFDHISQKEIIDVMTKKKLPLYIIIVFTNLEDLTRNIELRRRNNDRRGIFVFKQFSKRYTSCDNKDKQKIEKINRKNFKKLLLKYFKYEFFNEEDLINYSNKIFYDMNIMDDNNHYIKLRNEYTCNYLLITTNKTKGEIYKELQKIL